MMALPLVVSQDDGQSCRIENHIDVDSKKHLYVDSSGVGLIHVRLLTQILTFTLVRNIIPAFWVFQLTKHCHFISYT